MAKSERANALSEPAAGPQMVSETQLEMLRSACMCRPAHFRLRQWATQPDRAPAREDIAERHEQLSNRLNELLTCLHAQGKHRVLVITQGADTSGKDGTARALMAGLHPMAVRMVSFSVPTEAENARDFLWRVHQQVPRNGECVIFNRSHYEALFEPMVHQNPGQPWVQQSIEQVTGFEQLLTQTGTVVIKLFLHVSAAVQRQRLIERWENPVKRWKLTAADLKAAELFGLYMQSHERIMAATHTDSAPWWIIPADHKGFRNLLALEIVVGVLERLSLEWPDVDPAVKASGFWKTPRA